MSRSRLLLIVLIAAASLLITGAGTTFFLYHKATELDRSTPTVAVHQFLRAVFFDRSDERARLFTCPQWTDARSAQVRQRFRPEVKVSWESVTERSRQGSQSIVSARMRLVFQGFVDFQEWRFDVVDNDGWRVCGAVPSASPPN